jgi:histidinol-phosphatase (PHP family)
VQEKSPKILKGLEVDYIKKFYQEISGYVNQESWDLLLLSVHQLEDGLDVEEEKKRPQDKESSEERWVKYIALQKEALQTKLIPFNVLTHPVRLGKSSHSVPKNLDELLIELAEVAKKEDKALELNGNDLTSDPKLVKRLARACWASGCKVSFGSDAHHPLEVGRGYANALELIDEFGLTQL